MSRSHLRVFILLTVLIGLLALGTAPAFAGSASISSALPAGGTSTMPVVFISGSTCAGQGAFPVTYKAHAFTVDAAGTYTVDLSGVAGTFALYLNTSAFDPSAAFPSCLTADNTDPLGVSFGLTAGSTYYAVVIDDTFPQAGGSYTLTVSGPGNVYLADAGGGGASINDGRLNSFDLAAPYAIYCAANSLEIYAIDSAGHGTSVLTVTADQIAAADASAANTQVAEGGGIRVFKLTSGEIQTVGAPDFEGKVYNVIFSAFPCQLKGTALNG